jgi:hypothetical protein
LRFYISQTILTDRNDGEGFVYLPAIDNYTSDWRVSDMRINKAAHGKMFVECDPIDELAHQQILLDPLITYIPIEGGDGGELELDSALSLIPSAKRNALITTLENKQIPLEGLTLQNTVRDLLQRIILRLHIRKFLKFDDIPDGLDSEVNTFTLGFIKDKFAALGIIDLTKTKARELIKEIYLRKHFQMRTHYDN